MPYVLSSYANDTKTVLGTFETLEEAGNRTGTSLPHYSHHCDVSGTWDGAGDGWTTSCDGKTFIIEKAMIEITLLSSYLGYFNRMGGLDQDLIARFVACATWSTTVDIHASLLLDPDLIDDEDCYLTSEFYSDLPAIEAEWSSRYALRGAKVATGKFGDDNFCYDRVVATDFLECFIMEQITLNVV